MLNKSSSRKRRVTFDEISVALTAEHVRSLAGVERIHLGGAFRGQALINLSVTSIQASGHALELRWAQPASAGRCPLHKTLGTVRL